MMMMMVCVCVCVCVHVVYGAQHWCGWCICVKLCHERATIITFGEHQGVPSPRCSGVLLINLSCVCCMKVKQQVPTASQNLTAMPSTHTISVLKYENLFKNWFSGVGMGSRMGSGKARVSSKIYMVVRGTGLPHFRLFRRCRSRRQGWWRPTRIDVCCHPSYYREEINPASIINLHAPAIRLQTTIWHCIACTSSSK